MVFEFNSKIMGTSFKKLSDEIISILEEGDEFVLVPEPTNEFDKNAIQVYFGEYAIGYIAKDTAAKILDDVKADKVRCFVAQTTGGVVGRENRGCNLLIKVEREGDENGIQSKII